MSASVFVLAANHAHEWPKAFAVAYLIGALSLGLWMGWAFWRDTKK